MLGEKLKPCPFCGDTPIFEDVEERDDRRYVEMELSCCVTMKSTIGYNRFRDMTEAAIKKELTEKLTEKWNRRDGDTDAERYRLLIQHPEWKIDCFSGQYRIATTTGVITEWFETADEAVDAAGVLSRRIENKKD